jgi:hypothetical protein
MGRQSSRSGLIPRRATAGRRGSVGAAGEAADVTGGHAGLGVDLEEAGAHVRSAEESVRGLRLVRTPAEPTHGRGATGHRRGGGSGHHWVWSCAFWRAVIAVWAIGCATGGRPGPLGTRDVDVLTVCAPGRERSLGARTESSRRTDCGSTIPPDRGRSQTSVRNGGGRRTARHPAIGAVRAWLARFRRWRARDARNVARGSPGSRLEGPATPNRRVSCVAPKMPASLSQIHGLNRHYVRLAHDDRGRRMIQVSKPKLG